jgi:hypothetical protein
MEFIIEPFNPRKLAEVKMLSRDILEYLKEDGVRGLIIENK